MKKNDVQIGATYLVKVASNLVPVKITREHTGGGWEGTSVKTGKTIRIKSAQRLRKRLDNTAPVAARAAKATKNATAASGRDTGERGATGGQSKVIVGNVYTAKIDDMQVSVRIDGENPHGGWDATNLTAKKKIHIKSARNLRERLADKDASESKKRDTGERGATGGQRGANDAKPLSLLDAAARLLTLDSDKPMRCKDIVELAAARGLWAPRTGKTPACTLHAALSREIKTKGMESRFTKAERGKFQLQQLKSMI